MTKNLLFLLATVGLILNVGGCTSKKSQDENQVIENADVDKIEAEELSEAPQDPEGGDDASLQAALGETTETTETTTIEESTDQTLDASLDAAAPTDAPPAEGSAPTEEIAAAPTLDESSLNEVIPEPSIADSGAPIEEPAPIAEAPTMTEETSTTTTETTSSLAETPVVESSASDSSATASTETSTTDSVYTSSSYSSSKPSGSSELKKIALTPPYQSKVGWVNTVYVARPSENLKEISQKIYGSDKTKDLKKIAENSYLKNRSVRAGDKIYYSSPNRPEDSAKTLFYYEDMGMVPETYVAKSGDNLRKVAKNILGYDRAWVELWTSNPIDSKGKLAEGETIRYWRSASSIDTSAQNNSNVAATTPNPMDNNSSANLIDANQAAPPAGDMASGQPVAPPPDMNSMPPPPADAQQLAANSPPPPDDMNSLPPPPAEGELPPPPSMDANSLPPPPPPPDAAPPPPPMDANDQTAKANNADGEVTEAGALDNDTMMSLGAVGVLVAALAFILIRSKKKKAAEMAAMHETHIS